MSKKMAMVIAGGCVLTLAVLLNSRSNRTKPEPAATVREVGEDKSKKSDQDPSGERTRKGADAPPDEVAPIAAAPEVTGKQPEDVYAGMKADKVTFLKRVEPLLEPRAASEGVANTALREGGAFLAERAARAEAVVRLGRYRLKLTPESSAQLLRLTGRVLRYRPSGSFSRHRNERTDSLSTGWGTLLSEAEYLLRKKIRAAEPFDATAAEKIQSLRNPKYRPRGESQGADAFPDLETAILRGTLTGEELLPFLFYLNDCAGQIAWHRARDRQASDLLTLFSNEERFLILNGLDGQNEDGTKTVGRRYVRVDRSDMDAKYDFTAKANKAVDGILPALKSSFFTDTKFWKEFSAKYLDTVLEIESARQTRLMNKFTGADAQALESLRAAHVLHDELATWLEAAIPDSGYRIRRLATLDADGKVREQPIAPVEFQPIDPKRYVLQVEGVHEFFDRGKAFFISFHHTLDDPQPFSALEQVRSDEPADRIKYDLVSKAGTTWTYKDANGAKYVTRIDKSRPDTPIKGTTTSVSVTTGPGGTKDVSAESITSASGVYCSKINGLTVSPPMLVFPLSASKTKWSVDSKIGDEGRVTLKTNSQRKRMTVLGEERDVVVLTTAGTVCGKGYTCESVYCSGLGTVRESWDADGKAESRELIQIDKK